MANLTPIIKKLKNGTEVTLCSPQPGDGAELLAVMRTVMAESKYLLTEADEFNYTVEQEEEMIKAFLDHRDKFLITPKINNKFVGMLDFNIGSRRRIKHQGELGMSVATAYQGQGIGQLMLETLITWAKTQPQIETLRLSVASKNLPAYSLYKKIGFVEEGRQLKRFKFKDGTYDDLVLMALPLK